MSKKWWINLRDIAHGAIMAAVGAAGSVLVLAFANGALPDTGDLKKSGYIGISVGIGYILKKLTENSEGRILAKEKTSAEPKK